jgi:hypothetical protein
MAYQLPTIGDFKAQFVRDFPYATPLRYKGVTAATATASLNASYEVQSITVVTPGAGYNASQPPSVIIYGGGGIGAAATPVVVGGAVTQINVDAGGVNYRKAPLVYISVGGDDTDTEKVTDYDIARAFTAAMQFNFTEGLFGTQAAFVWAYNLLAAHYLCETVIAGGTGLSGQSTWLTNSKTVGNVTESYTIPDRILKSPFLSKLSKTTYGAQFLELVSPQLIGNFQSFHRDTLP